MRDHAFESEFVAAMHEALSFILASVGVQNVQATATRARTSGDRWNEVTGIITYSGDIAGAVALTAPLATANAMVHALAGEMLSHESEDYTDAFGELVNMICGRTKAALRGENSISVPTVVIGDCTGRAAGLEGPTTVVLCESGLGPFAVEFAIRVRAAGLASSAKGAA